MVQIVTPNTSVTSLGSAKFAQVRMSSTDLEHLPDSLTVLQWISLFDPVVDYRVATNVRTATIRGESLGGAVTAVYADLARMSCAAFNALPEAARHVPPPATAVQREPYDEASDAACTSGGNVSTYWWGVTFYLNHCLCNDVELAVATGAGASGVAAAITSAIPGAQVASAVLGAIAATLALYSAGLTWADTHCNGVGADVSTTWVAPTPWIKSIC